MKAISIRQPWAELILQGRKTLELRTWTVSHRGTLAIHASQTINRAACKAFGLNPDQVAAGALIGTVELVGISELSEAEFEARKDEHLAAGRFHFKAPMHGWQLANPRALAEPAPLRGRMGLFNVTDPPLQAELKVEPEPIRQVKHPFIVAPADRHARLSETTPFQLRVVPCENRPGAYSLALYQRPVSGTTDASTISYLPDDAGMRRVGELGGDSLRAVADHMLDALRRSGYRATDLGANRREPFHLGEETGVRLGLLFMALKPVTKSSRVEAISQGLRRMTSEEAYYWYSKCATGTSASPGGERAHDRARKALRVLLADE